MIGNEQKPDRYVSFKGIDCVGNARRLMVMLRRHIDDPLKTNPFWEKFKVKIEAASTPAANGLHQDELFLIHSYINNLQELFEEYDDREALALLRRIELECC